MSNPRLISVDSAVEPITLEQAKLNVRAYSSTTEDSLITRLITVARETCEEELEVSLVPKTWEVTQDSFYPTRIELPNGPIRSVESVTYVEDENGADTVIATDQYRIDATGTVPALITAFDVDWPTDVRLDTGSVRVRYTAGYPSTDSPPETVPKPVLQAMHLLIGHYYKHREAVDEDGLMELPQGVRYLLGKYRRGLGV